MASLEAKRIPALLVTASALASMTSKEVGGIPFTKSTG